MNKMRINKRRIGVGKTLTQDKSINAQQFLGKQGGAGYSNPAEFAAYLDSLRDDEYDQLGDFIDAAKEGCKLSNVTQTRKDRSQRTYLFPVPLRPKSGSGLKVILEAGMARFIEDYVNGNVEITFTLEELDEESRLA